MLETNPPSPADQPIRIEEAGQEIPRLLQRTRLARGEDLAEIARVLRIREAYLAALEQGQFELIVGRPYLLGFLRSYASHLGLDGEELAGTLKAWLDRNDPPPAADERKPATSPGRVMALSAAGALLLVAAVYVGSQGILSGGEQLPGTESARTPADVAGTAPAPAEPPMAAGGTTRPGAAEQPPSDENVAAAPVPASSAEPASPAAEATGPDPAGPATGTAMASGESTATGQAGAAPPEAAPPSRPPASADVAATSDGAQQEAAPEPPSGIAASEPATPPAAPGEPPPASDSIAAAPPSMPPAADVTPTPSAAPPAADMAAAPSATPPATDATPAPASVEPAAAPTEPPPPAETTTAAATAAPEKAPALPSDSGQAAAPSSTPPSATATPAPPTPAPRGGQFALHLASVRDPAVVAGEWQRVVKHHPSLAGLEPLPPMAVSIPGKGTYYRVVAGSFATRAEARAECERLRAENQYCMVVTP
ncbi:helix-turn-helix domain-containing protein [Benzoatithermus flavus]|uniref:Helix-turn-helix domain-containing protein n=1 Tax=Benzoatithermus flavus TaxID=3108223 RepID=A0ABU8XMB6_9PROT